MMGKVDLAALILELALKETSSNALQEKTELSPKVFDEQLEILKSKALIDILNAGKSVKVTKRGTQFLDLYKSIHAKYLTVQAQ